MFVGRGGSSNSDSSSRGNSNNNSRGSNDNNFFDGNNTYVYVYYDVNMLKMDIAIAIGMFLFVGFLLLFAYKMPYFDPIANIKRNLYIAQVICALSVGSLISLNLIFVKERGKAIRNMLIIMIAFIITIIAQIIYLGALSKTYNDAKFEEFYNTYEKKEEDNKKINAFPKKRVQFSVSGIKISEEKEAYINTSKTAFKNFKTKAILLLIPQIALLMLIIYLIYKLTVIYERKNRLEKDDVVVYDPVQDIKY